ncbi:endochitinase [Collybia nuda]|uniref:Endochitinase n=1 Tax=Collybia nuda TaxID=64659 RepID=A0A9P5Y572_9AGAR|nr:endochitinase [Collybia nuda]
MAIAGSDFVQPLAPRGSEGSLSVSALPKPMVSTAWYAGWHVVDFPLSTINWSKYTQMTYAFAVTTPDPAIISVMESDEVLIPQFVAAAHKNEAKASLSIGGWTGSRWFSPNVGSSQNRTAFVKSVSGLVKKYKLDGVDFDWEYPGRQGIGCNIVNSNDTVHFLSFLQELRQSLGPNVTLSAATDVTPFAGPSGAPSPDISEFSKVLDYIAIMNYDLKSSPSTGAGPNAPLDDACAPPDRQFGSATSAVSAWTAAGMPFNQIVLGVPAYGRSYRVAPVDAFVKGSNTTLALYPFYDMNHKPPGDKWNGEGGLDVCGIYQPPGGVYAYPSLIEGGFLNSDGSVKHGIAYRYDECSETPYVYNPETETLVTFDNAQSFASKGDFIKTMGLKGFAMWEAAGDPNNILINAILNGTMNGAPRTQKSPAAPGATSSTSSASHHLSWSRPRALENKMAIYLIFVFVVCGWAFL